VSKRVIFVHHYSQISGAERVLINIITGLRDYKIEPVLACPAGELVSRMESEGVQVRNIVIPVLQKTCNPFRLLLFFFRLVQVTASLLHIIHKKRIEIVYANSFTACLFCGPAAYLLRRRLIWHMHDLISDTASNRFFISLAGKSADTIIATTSVMKQNLVSLGVVPDKIAVIPNGIDLQHFDPQKVSSTQFREELGLSSEIPLIGIVGQLTPWKGHRHFLNAACKVVEKDRSAKFLIIGDSRLTNGNIYRKELENLVGTLGLSKNVIFTGFRTDIRRIVSSLDILVNASSSEPFGMTIIEAMALGTPVVATETGGVSEIITDGKDGKLFPAGNADRLAIAILDILDDPFMAKKLSKQALKTVSDGFSLPKQNSRIFEVLQKHRF
jgi:glycosyltransferase involved in cell wall biosynthesis